MPTVERTVTVEVTDGLHMKSASLISSAVAELDTVVTIRVNGDQALATNPLKLTSFNVPSGESIHVRATGPDAESAVRSVKHVLSGDSEDE